MTVLKKDIENILIVRNDRFGEFLLNIPALRALKETFKQVKITAVVSPNVGELAQNIPYIGEVICWGQKKYTLAEKIRLINLLRSKKIDAAIMLNPSKEFNIITYLAGIPIRLGYARKFDFLLSHKIKDTKHLGQKHEVEHNLELVALIGAKTFDKSLFFPLDESIDLNSYFNLDGLKGDKLVILHPWTSDTIKQWPESNFYALAKRLLIEPEIKLAIIGGKDESARSIDFCKGLNQERAFNLTGKTSLNQLALLLKKSRLIISGDSGPVHLACAVGTPALAIFRNDIPGKTAKRWGPWLEDSAVIEKNNLRDITVDEVFKKTMEMI